MARLSPTNVPNCASSSDNNGRLAALRNGMPEDTDFAFGAGKEPTTGADDDRDRNLRKYARYKIFLSDIAGCRVFGPGVNGYELALRAALRRLQGDGG